MTCGSPTTSPVHLPDGSPHPDYSFEQTERDIMSTRTQERFINSTEDYILNIPTILELRQRVSALEQMHERIVITMADLGARIDEVVSRPDDANLFEYYRDIKALRELVEDAIAKRWTL